MLLVFLFLFVLGLGHLIWMAVTAWRRQWKKLGLQLLGGAACFGALWFANASYDRFLRDRYFEGLFSTTVQLPSPLFHYASPRAFNGDGYTFEVYPLPPEIRRRFATFDPPRMAGLPRRPDYRSHWKSSPWRSTPANEKDQPYIDFVLAFAGTGESPELNRRQQDTRRLLTQPGRYFAYFHFDHGDHPGNVDLFIVDLEHDRLYFINLNT